MKRLLKTYIRLGFLMCLLACLLTLSVLAGEERWGYQQLEGNQKLQKVYESLQRGIAQKKTEISLERGITLNSEELTTVNTMLRADYPEYFWYTGMITISGSKAFPFYEHASRWEQFFFEHEANEILMGMQLNLGRNASDDQKALYLHDVLAQNIVYDVNCVEEQSAYSALVEGKAVCAGYARAYQYLLNRVGIDAWTVEGWGVRPDSGASAHAWTLLWLDGDCYYTDLTWDDQNNHATGAQNTFHAYFNRSLEEISAEHVVTDPLFLNALPSCAHSGMDYFAKNSGEKGVLIADDGTTTQQMVDSMLLMNEDGPVHYLWDIWYTGSDFGGWLNSRVGDFLDVSQAPAGSYGISYTSLGREIQLEIYHASGKPVGWPQVTIEYDHDAPYQPEGEYEIIDSTLTAKVEYFGSGLEAQKNYLAWVAYFHEDGSFAGISMTTLQLDEHLEGELSAEQCPEGFENCRVFIIGEADQVQPDYGPLCQALDLVQQ